MRCLKLLFLLQTFLLIQIGKSNSEKIDVDFSPSHYDITLRLITDEKIPGGKPFTALGNITIDGVSNIATNQLSLNAGRKVEINQASVIIKSVGSNTTRFTVKNVTNGHYSLVIQIDPEIKANQKLTIYLEFISPISQNCDGWGGAGDNFCYTNGTTDKAFFTGANPPNMIPCFYEHRDGKRKATIRLKLIRPNELNNTIGNTRVESSVPDPDYPGWTVDTMKQTKVLSMDEFAFASTNYGYIEKSFGKGKSFRLHAPNEDFTNDTNDTNKLDTYAKKCISILNFLEEYYDQPQSVPKLDVVLTPSGVVSVPWGINIVSKNYPSMINNNYPLDADLFNVFVQTFPIQWVENIFTVHNDVKNGIVHYVSQKTQLALDKKNGYFDLVNTRNTFLDHRYAFPSNGILNLLKILLSPETVKKGVLDFVKHGLTSEQEFHTTLQAAANKDGHSLGNLTVKNISDMWSTQPGYPLLRVWSTPNDYINISLEAVKPVEGSNDVVSSDSKWTVASKFKQNLTETRQTLVLIDTEGKNVIVKANLHDWLKSGGRGYYRTVFDDNTTRWIQQQLELNFKSFDTLTRAYLLQDYNIFAKQGLVSYKVALNLIKYISNETESVVYNEFASIMKEIHNKFLFSPEYALIKNYTSKKLGDLWKSAAAADYPKSDLYTFSCNLGESVCYQWAQKYIVEWNVTGQLNSVIQRSSTLPSAMMCSMVASGGKSAFEFVLNVFEKLLNSKQDIGEDMVKALACVKDYNLVQELLNKTITKDYSSVLPHLADKEIGQTFILPFLSANWEQQIGNGTYNADKVWNTWFVQGIINKLADHMSTPAQLKELEDFIKTHEKSLKEIKDELENHVNRVKQNIAWMDTQGKDILDFIKLQE